MVKIKTSELTGPALDWAVAKCEGWEDDLQSAEQIWEFDEYGGGPTYCGYAYSSDWAQGGPIIERELIRIISPTIKGIDWVARIKCSMVGTAHEWLEGYGPAPLIAAMRCYVASKLGDEVEIPEELK